MVCEATALDAQHLAVDEFRFPRFSEGGDTWTAGGDPGAAPRMVEAAGRDRMPGPEPDLAVLGGQVVEEDVRDDHALSTLNPIDEHWHVYQYVVKRTIPPVSAATCSQPVANEAIQERVSYLNGRRSELFEIRLFVVLLYEPPTRARTSTSMRDLLKSPLDGLRRWLSPAETLRVLGEDLDRAVATLHHKADAFQVQLNDIGLAMLPKGTRFSVLPRAGELRRGRH